MTQGRGRPATGAPGRRRRRASRPSATSDPRSIGFGPTHSAHGKARARLTQRACQCSFGPAYDPTWQCRRQTVCCNDTASRATSGGGGGRDETVAPIRDRRRPRPGRGLVRHPRPAGGEPLRLDGRYRQVRPAGGNTTGRLSDDTFDPAGTSFTVKRILINAPSHTQHPGPRNRRRPPPRPRPPLHPAHRLRLLPPRRRRPLELGHCIPVPAGRPRPVLEQTTARPPPARQR